MTQQSGGALNITVDFASVGFDDISVISIRVCSCCGCLVKCLTELVFLAFFLQDLFARENLGNFTYSFTGTNIPLYGTQMLKLQLAD